MIPLGFQHAGYAESLTEFGTPRELKQCGGWLLERPIGDSGYRDAMGCYPLFVCRDWTSLAGDLQAVGSDLVSVSLVSDPFGSYDPQLLQHSFDIVKPFKEHYVADLTRPLNTIASSHHRYYARKALRTVSIEVCEDPSGFVDEWTGLYAATAARFKVNGLRAFSQYSFERQLRVPGAVLFRALHNGIAVAAHLVFRRDTVCYGHLVGSTPASHELLASYALYWSELEYFSGKAAWFDWGAGAGLSMASDGLTQFKQGWSTGTRMTWFCGKITRPDQYREMVRAAGNPQTEYFPAYRMGEFG